MHGIKKLSKVMEKILINQSSSLKTWIALFLSINLTGIGVALFVQANLGSDTITVFIDGFKNVLGMSLGASSRVYNLIALVIAILLSRKDIGWCTVVYAIFVGYSMDFYNALIVDLDIMHMNMIIRLFVVVLGQLSLGLSYALLIIYRKGMNQMDAISYGIVNRCNLSYSAVRTMLNIVLLLAGWLMGGVVGIGSIIAMATTGYLVDYILNIFNKKREAVIN